MKLKFLPSLILSLLTLWGSELRAAPSPLYPSSPHRVLRVEGDPQTYYLVEKGQALILQISGPCLVELSFRRIIFLGEQGVQPTLVKLVLDEEMQAPIAFRRAGEPSLRFVEENRFTPSAQRNSKIAIKSGDHNIQLSVGSNTTAVAVALTAQFPEGAQQNKTPQAYAQDLPPLEPLVSPSTKPERVRPEPITKPLNSDAQLKHNEPPREDTPPAPAQPSGAQVQDPATGDVQPALGQVVQAAPTRFIEIGVGLGMATNFIGLGAPSPELHMELRYPIPGFDNKLHVQLNAQLSHYALNSQSGGEQVMQLDHWLVPITLGGSYALWRQAPWQVELGAALGFATNSSQLVYRGLARDSLGIGAAFGLWSELAWSPGFGQIFLRGQLDALSASNALMPNAHFLGANLATGYRVCL